MAPIPDVVTPLLWVCAVSVPLGLWKLGEIVWWLATRVSISLH